MSKPKRSRGSDSEGRSEPHDPLADKNKVGPGRPPVEFQWRPNESGNRKGRPKGSKNRKTIVRAAERKLFTVKKAGRPRKMTATEIGIHNLQQDILRGERKAFLDYLEILERYGDRDELTASMTELLAEDLAILKNREARLSRRSAKSGGDS